MRLLHWKLLLSLGLLSALTPFARADVQIWAMAGAGNGQLFEVNPATNATTLVGAIKDPVLGDVGAGWSTDAIDQAGTLYFLRRLQNQVNLFSLDSHNIQVSGGVITNVQLVGATGLGGNLDGLTVGPDKNVYMAAYQNTAAGVVNGLFRYVLASNTVQYVGTFANNAGPGGRNSFYTDLAFDPKNGDLLGTGTDSNGAFIPYRLASSAVIGKTNQTFNYVDAYNTWNGNLYDGLAFNNLTGDLYASGDFGGVYQINPATGGILKQVDNGVYPQIGTDLAVLPTFAGATPEPSSLIVVLGVGCLGLLKRGLFRKRSK